MLNKKFLLALSTLIGMIVGVGFFGIPYAMSQAGFLTGFFYLVLLTGAVLSVHLLYGEIILRTNGEHRLVGYAEKYLGGRGKKLTSAVIIFEFYGALLAYIIAGGQFLNIIFGKVFGGSFNTFINGFSFASDAFWSLAFFIFGSLLILFGLRAIAFSEFFMTVFLLALAALFILRGLPLIKMENLAGLNLGSLFLPYGVILFSLTGGAAIPEIRQILRGEEKKLKKIIVLGTLIPAFVYALFALSVVGVSGAATTKNAISGLAVYFGEQVLVLGAVFGFLAVITSYLMLGLNLRKVFQYDHKLPGFLSWFLACFVPLFGYFLGLRDFLVVIGLVGAVAGGLEGLITILIYRKAKKANNRQPEYSLKFPALALYSLAVLFILGIIYQFVYLSG